MTERKYKQNNIKIGNVVLPKINYSNKIYYPYRYTYEKVLLKHTQSIDILKKNGYEKDLLKIKVSFNFNNGGTHNTYCISENGLINLLNNSNIGGLTIKQKQSMNLLLEYLGQDLINENPRFIKTYEYINSNDYDDFEKDCIYETLKENEIKEWQKCTKCNKYYPFHTNFFTYNNRDNVASTYCRNCVNTDERHKIKHSDNYLNNIYNRYGNEVYVYYKTKDIINIYEHYVKNNVSMFPKPLKNKESYLKIIKFLYEDGKINKDKLTLSYLTNEHKLKRISLYLKNHEIHEYLFGDEPKQYPWKYKKYNFPVSPTTKEGRVIFNNYLKENNIIIKDIYNFNYSNILKATRLSAYFGSDILGFVMNYYDNKYPAYKFNIASVNYWKQEERRDRALKYLIENDMKLEIEKVPLYLTMTSIRNVGTATMYDVLKKYYDSLFEWVNEVYPDIFDPKDFDINYMRDEFDSVEESIVNDILRDNFDNVLYNPRNTDYTIEFFEKVPDWFIFTATGVIIVEYFGLWAKKRGMYNSRTRDYIINSKDKIEKYKELKGYRFLYIFPEDLDNNYEGLYNKIEDIKNNKKLNKVM